MRRVEEFAQSAGQWGVGLIERVAKHELLQCRAHCSLVDSSNASPTLRKIPRAVRQTSRRYRRSATSPSLPQYRRGHASAGCRICRKGRRVRAPSHPYRCRARYRRRPRAIQAAEPLDERPEAAGERDTFTGVPLNGPLAPVQLKKIRRTPSCR